jgi:D-galactarolactone cycloisomerase
MTASIAAISAFLLQAPVVRSFSASAVRGGHTHRKAVLVRVDAGGVSGWGETFPALGSPSEPILEHIRTVLAPALLDGDPLAVRDLNTAMRRASRGMGTGAIRGISALDIALWDLRGRLLGQPVCRLLGAQPGATFPTVATAVFYPPEADDPGPRVDDARRHVAAGLRAVKVKIGGLSPERDLAHVEQIRRALPEDVMLCADANSGYALRTALHVARGLEAFPIEDVEGYRALAAATGMWTAGGQDLPSSQAFLPLLEARALHIVQPSVAAVGGVSEAVAAADQAARFGFRYCPTGWGTGLLVAASLHARAVTASAVTLPAPDLDWIEFDVSDNPLRDIILREPLLPERGVFTVPGGAGLGVEVDTEGIRPVTEAAFTVRP